MSIKTSKRKIKGGHCRKRSLTDIDCMAKKENKRIYSYDPQPALIEEANNSGMTTQVPIQPFPFLVSKRPSRKLFNSSSKFDENNLKNVIIKKKDLTPQESFRSYSIQQTIGSGTFSTVLRASRDGQDFAVKIIDKKEIKENPLISDCIKSEMDILRITKHPNIISINDSFEDQDRIYIVMEIGGCDLFHFMENFCRKGLAVDKTRRIFSQLVDAVYFLHHDAMLCHRDLKLENILVKKHSLEVKVCDFGLSCKIDKVKMLRTRCGSLEYVSPEIIKGEPYRGEQVDCWALGVILFALGTGVLPFILDPSRPKSVYHKICRGEYSYPRYQTNVTPLMKDLISRILVPSPTERLSICEIRNHPFLSSPKDNVYTTELI